MEATAGVKSVGLSMSPFLYIHPTITLKMKDNDTQIPVQIPASFGLMMWGFLLNTPKSKAKNKKINARKTIQTVMILY